MPKAKKTEKPPKKTLNDFNKGYNKRKLAVGENVDIFKIPYKAKFKTYSGRITAIISEGSLGYWCKVWRLDKGTETIEYIYTGKIYEGWDKPFS